jgi:hypothetical protein
MLITVTPVDIITGRRGYASDCPIAKALQRHFPTVPVTVGGGITIGSASLPMPVSVQLALMQFDQTGLMAPFSFLLG